MSVDIIDGAMNQSPGRLCTFPRSLVGSNIQDGMAQTQNVLSLNSSNSKEFSYAHEARDFDANEKRLSGGKNSRKSPHNAIEKRYRQSINGKIDELRDLLNANCSDDLKANKSAVLRRAIDRIRLLEKENECLRMRLSALLNGFAFSTGEYVLGFTSAPSLVESGWTDLSAAHPAVEQYNESSSSGISSPSSGGSISLPSASSFSPSEFSAATNSSQSPNSDYYLQPGKRRGGFTV
ncbi:unnamed protein product [Dibothriocephalus latus]|uniref:BHLH domain-containing protein n=1 Tax=Dibothriocephalus latus TaxID=60516 RepID=A0A3P7NV94_DIBLA|nr:unnamed protein product [Dibothriocephalus latus]